MFYFYIAELSYASTDETTYTGVFWFLLILMLVLTHRMYSDFQVVATTSQR